MWGFYMHLHFSSVNRNVFQEACQFLLYSIIMSHFLKEDLHHKKIDCRYNLNKHVKLSLWSTWEAAEWQVENITAVFQKYPTKYQPKTKLGFKFQLACKSQHLTYGVKTPKLISTLVRHPACDWLMLTRRRQRRSDTSARPAPL